MDAVKFINGKERMCGSFNGRCTGCDIAARLDEHETCHNYVRWHPVEAVKIVERWVKAHPLKTRQSEYLKLFPRARTSTDGTISLCPGGTDLGFVCPNGSFDCNSSICDECQKQYWLAGIEDDEAETE